MEETDSTTIFEGCEEVIAKALDSLKSDPNADKELLDILSMHILSSTPLETAADDAATAIQELAQKRAEGE